VVWASFSSLQQLEAAAVRRGTSMPVSTANRALNTDRLPTAEFVRRFVISCGADVATWIAARDTLADARYLRDGVPDESALPSIAGVEDVSRIDDVCPYPGLAAFSQDHARWFFGREQVTAELLSILVERLAGTGPLLVVGPSGTGKSSLLQAGLLAALSEGRLPGSTSRTQLVFTPTADPVQELADQVTSVARSGHRDLTAALLSDPGHLVDVLREASDTVLVVDQFEEIFTLCSDERHRQAFIRAVCAAATSDDGPPAALVVLGLRADFYGRCAAYPELIEALRHGQVLLGAMNDAELRAAVEKPAHAVGLELEPGLLEIMLSDLGHGDVTAGEPGYQPGTLPLLSHALLATWQQRDGQILTIAGYRLTGGISGAIATTAERAFRRLDQGQQEIARSVLLRMIQLGDGTGDTRRQVDRARIVAESGDPAGVEAVLDVLIHARLVTTHAASVEIIHEALLRAWPRLREWLNTDRTGLLLEQRLVEAAEIWADEGRHDSDLYRGTRLAAVQERVDGARDLPGVASEFLRASVEHERDEQRGLLRRTRRLRRLVVVLSCLVLLAVVTTASAIKSQDDLLGQRDIDLSREVAGSATALQASNAGLAAQLSVVAFRISRTAEARGAMMSTLVNLNLTGRSDHDNYGDVWSVAFSQNGELLVAASKDKIARVWRLGSRPSLAEPPIAYLHHPREVRSAVFSPGDRFLATSSADHTVRLWAVADLSQNEPVARTLPEHAGPLAFSPDGTMLATGGTAEATARLWDLTGGEPVPMPELVGHRDDVLAMAFSPDGKTLATGSADGTALLWDVSDPSNPSVIRTIKPDAGFVYAVAFGPVGHLLATGHEDTTARLWDVGASSPLELSVLAGHVGEVDGIAFTPDGNTLATASHDTASKLWNVSDPRQATVLATPLIGDAGSVYSVAFSSDGHTLATGNQGHEVHLWETDTDRVITEICGTAGATITRAEWDRHLPDQEYEPPCPTPARVDHPVIPQVTPAPPAGSTQLVASHSDKCVAIEGGVPVDRAPAYQIGCTGAPSTKWYLREAAEISPDGALYRIVTASSDMCLGSSDSEQKDGDATQVVQRPCTEDTAAGQLWRIDVVGRGSDWMDVRFINTGHKDCLDIIGESITDDAHVVRWPCGDRLKLNQVFQVSSSAVGPH